MKNKTVIKNQYTGKQLNIPIPKYVSEYTGIIQANIGDEAIVWTGTGSLEKGVITGVTLKVIHIYLSNGKFTSIKWGNVRDIIKQNKG